MGSADTARYVPERLGPTRSVQQLVRRDGVSGRQFRFLVPGPAPCSEAATLLHRLQ